MSDPTSTKSETPAERKVLRAAETSILQAARASYDEHDKTSVFVTWAARLPRGKYTVRTTYEQIVTLYELRTMAAALGYRVVV